MVAPGEKLQGAPPVPTCYPNPVANNVNFHPMTWSYRTGTATNKQDGVTWNQTDPIGPGPGNGTQVSHA